MGKPFGEFDPEKQAVLRQARLQAIDRLAAAARAAGAGHVLVAGDVYDGNLESRQLLKPLSKLAGYGDIHWHLLPGNHDPASPAGLWERISAAGVPDNVVLHLEPRPCEIEPGVFLLPAPLKAKTISRDPTGWMNDAVTPAAALRIGLAHGSVHGFDSAGEAAVELDPARPESAGLAYLALGDWHGLKQVNERVWYSGTPEPDRFKANNSGHALIVRLAGNDALPEVTQVPTAAYDWRRRSLDIGGADDLQVLDAELEDSPFQRSNTLLRLELSGTVRLAEDAAIALALERLETSLFHLRRRFGNLHVAPETDDLMALDDSELRAAAERLRDMIGAEGASAKGAGAKETGRQNSDRGAAAERALRLMFQMACRDDNGSTRSRGGRP